MKISFKLFSLLLAFSVLISACSTAAKAGSESNSSIATGKVVEYGLETAMIDGQMAFIGVGGGIDWCQQSNSERQCRRYRQDHPDRRRRRGARYCLPRFQCPIRAYCRGREKHRHSNLSPTNPASFTYNCLLPGHKEAGMAGKFEVTGEASLCPCVTTRVGCQCCHGSQPDRLS